MPLAAIPVLCVGLLDWLTWGQMFRSFWMNIYLNIREEEGKGLEINKFHFLSHGF